MVDERTRRYQRLVKLLRDVVYVWNAYLSNHPSAHSQKFISLIGLVYR
jgi:hypothetical protein